MPAIQPERLQRQSAELAATFESPGKFIRELDHLFEFYADRATTSEETETLHRELYSFNPPSQLINHIRTDLQAIINEYPEKSFELAEALWSHPIHEARILAVYILGSIQYSPNSSEVYKIQSQLLDHITRWKKSAPDHELLAILADDGLTYWRKTDPDMLLDQIAEWLKNSKMGDAAFGLTALKALIMEPDYENLPGVFTIIRPLIEKSDRSTRAELRSVIMACAARSALETLTFLEKLSSSADPKNFKWLIRYSSASFPDEMSVRLRRLLRSTASG
ncbi:MAG: DNA alkylation repair protein [Chloroflexota bacterium]